MRLASPSAASRALTLLAVLTSVAGCATKGDVRDVERQIQDLSRSTQAIQLQLEQQGRITADTLRNQTNSILDFQGNVTRQLRTIEDMLDQLVGLTGQNQRTIQAIRDEMEQLRRTATVPQVPPDPAATGSTDPNAPVEAYNAAADAYNRRSNIAARIGFEDFIRQFPNDTLVPSARYFLADIKVQEDDFEGALEDFQSIRQLHPGSDEVPRALLRIANLYEVEFDDEGEACRNYQIIVNSYQDSEAAEEAAQAIRRLGCSGP